MLKYAESAKIRYKRYKNAKSEYDLVKSRLIEIYEYFSPRVASFTDEESRLRSDRSNSLTRENFDSTAQEALIKYASNLQASLLPPYRQWTYIKPSPVAEKQFGKDSPDIAKFKEQLDEISETLFHTLSDSNINSSINEGFSDMGCSTGVIFINERASEYHTISYNAVAPDRVFFSEDSFGVRLQNFWSDRVVKARDIKQIWKDAKLNARIQAILEKDGDGDIQLIEGCIYYPDKPDSDKYLYYVQDEEKLDDIVTRWLPYCPYTGFRAFKRSGEIWGRGVADRMLPFAKLLNKMTEYGIQIIKFSAFPPIGVVNAGPGFNTNTIQILPGAVVNMPAPNSIQPLRLGGDPQHLLFERDKIVAALNEAFYADPMGEVNDVKDRTATEMQLRQEAWLRTNSVSVGRIYKEAIEPLIQKTLIAMRRKGIIQDPQLGDTVVKLGESTHLYRVSFESPLVGLQGKDDAVKVDGFMQRLEQMFGANALALVKNADLIEFYAEKLGVPTELVQDKETIEGIIDHVTKTLEQNKDQLAQQKLSELSEQQPQPQQQQSGVEAALKSLREMG